MKKVVIFDIDNTILYHTNRSPFNWTDLSGDTMIPQVLELMRTLSEHYYIFLVTGRPDTAREATIEYLIEGNVPCAKLYTKAEAYEKGYIYKERILKEIQEKYEVLMAFDDDQRCIDMYVRNNIIIMRPMNYLVTETLFTSVE